MQRWGRRLVRAVQRAAAAAGFTPGEQRLVLFLVGAFFAGFALKMFGVGERPAAMIDYRQLDSVFAARSRAAEPPAAQQAAAPDSAPAAPHGRLVDLNNAGKEELMTLPGIGPTLAGRIVAYRTEVEPFSSVSDLLRVKGIGRKKLEQLAPLCTVNE